MIIKTFFTSLTGEVKDLVLGVLKEQGFEYDPVKDFDLDDIDGYYLKNGGVFYVGLVDGHIIGTGAVRRIGDERCEIKRIYVRKDFRKMGFGRDLFLMALKFTKLNYSAVSLKTDTKLTDAIELYLKNGFSAVREEDRVVYFSKIWR